MKKNFVFDPKVTLQAAAPVTSPICATEEYPSILLGSVCFMPIRLEKKKVIRPVTAIMFSRSGEKAGISL